MTNSTVTLTSEPEVEPTRHGPIAQLLIALSPLSLILIGYALAHWITAPLLDDPTHATNRIGIGLQVSGPADVDRSFSQRCRPSGCRSTSRQHLCRARHRTH